ncbi:histidine phosphatase family protein [Candidatus Gracilibacteria bacterium]|nr:histidine phosphatase family protein [Candidatus Gracilibacteria bacterium]
MLSIYIARHGQDEDNAEGLLNGRRDRPLTQKGQEQAEELARKIKADQLSFDSIYTSPLQRARMTAEAIAKINAMPAIETYDQLVERDVGIFSGISSVTAAEQCSPDILETPTGPYILRPEGGETFDTLLERGHQILHTIKNKHQDGNILLVCHGGIGKMIYAAYHNLPWQDVLKQFHFGNSELVLLAPNRSPQESQVFTSN